jgi:hypothetical protein
MRITRDTLLKIAKDTVRQRVEADHGIIAAFLIGSMLDEDPFLGGTADVDLLFIADQDPGIQREIVQLNPEVHIDISYEARSEYDPARKLRTDPWRGYTMYDPSLLYERQHFFEYTQAIVRSQFDEPVNRAARVRHHYEHARQVWVELQRNANPGAPDMVKYFKAVNHAANAVAGLSGGPLTERRLLVNFPARAQAIEKPEMNEALLSMLGGLKVDGSTITTWLPDWQEAFNAAAERKADARIHPARLAYYKQAIEALAGGEQPASALWPLLHTWTISAATMPDQRQPVKIWGSVLEQIGVTGAGFEGNLQTLDRLLDAVEEIVDGMVPT